MLIERLTYIFAGWVYTNSTGLQAYIKNELRFKTPIKVLGKGSTNGIDSNFFKVSPELALEALALRKEYGLTQNDIVFSFVGRIVKDKGISDLLAAFKILQQEHPHECFKLMLIGPFEQDIDPITEDEFKFVHEHPDLILAGFRNDVRPWIMASDIFVFPSYREGFPNVVMQACCLEVPCIVSDINGCNEIIDHQKTGLSVPVKNASSLAEAMYLLASDENQRKAFSKRARAHVVQHFDRERVWEELLKEYQKNLLIKKIVRNN